APRPRRPQHGEPWRREPRRKGRLRSSRHHKTLRENVAVQGFEQRVVHLLIGRLWKRELHVDVDDDGLGATPDDTDFGRGLQFALTARVWRVVGGNLSFARRIEFGELAQLRESLDCLLDYLDPPG